MSDAVLLSSRRLPSSTLPPRFEVATSTTPLPSTFNQTTRNLLKLGSLPIDRFAQDSSEELEGFDVFHDVVNLNASGHHLGDTTTQNVGNEEEASDEIPDVPPSEAVRYLREVALRVLGRTNTDPLQYEFLEDFGQNRGSCILTITRPNGLSRSYRTKSEFNNKNDAKIDAASSAIKLGAVYFLKYGEGFKVDGKRSLVLAKLDAGMNKDESKVTKLDSQPDDEQDDTAAAQIETCCIEWRAGAVVPKWVHLIDQKIPNSHGFALKISLSSNIQRAYSVLISEEYPRRSAAKSACARVALQQNVLEFIKHGDGLEHPIVVPYSAPEAVPQLHPSAVMTLQAFHAALPKPLPDRIDVKSNGEVNAVGWLNTIIQITKGSRMTVTYTWHTDVKLGLHGCLLRLSRPDDIPGKSYLVEAIFAKRADAKIAVCLLACSQGVGNYVREVAAEVDSRVTVDMRRRSTETILPALAQAFSKFKHGSRPEFLYECDVATYSCTLTIDLSPDPDTPIKREWKVPMAYKSKADAKSAVVCMADDDGLMDFVKNRGNKPSDEVVNDAQGSKQSEGELEEGETTETVKKKKKKKGKKDVTAEEGASKDGDIEAELLRKVRDSRKTEPVFETREEALANGRFNAGQNKQPQRPFIGGRGRGYRGRGFGWNARGTFGFGPPRPPGFSSGFPLHPGLGPPIRPSGVPHLPYHHGYAHFNPLGAHGTGYSGDAYGAEYDHRDRDYLLHGHSDPRLAHTRHMHGPGAASTNAATQFVHVPPPVQPRVASGHGNYNDPARDYDYRQERDYRSGSFASQSSSGAVLPYGNEYPSATARVLPPPPLHETGAAEYSYADNGHADRPAHGVLRAHEQEHRAPDYDRIPGRGAAMAPRVPEHPASHARPSQPHSLSHSHASGSLGHLHGSTQQVEHLAPMESQHQRTLHNSDRDVVEKGRAVNERAAYGKEPRSLGLSQRQSPGLVNPAPGVQANTEEQANGVTSKLEKEAAKIAETERRDREPNKPEQNFDSSSKSSRSLDGITSSTGRASVVPSKRERSPDRDRDPKSTKRIRGRSKSTSPVSERMDRRESERPPCRSNSVHHDESRGQATVAKESGEKPLKSVRDMSPAREKREGSRPKKSYVAELFAYCNKESLSRPELCHEEIASESDKDGRVFKVWIVMGNERLELSMNFKTLDVGQERVAKSVLKRLRMQTQTQKKTEA